MKDMKIKKILGILFFISFFLVVTLLPNGCVGEDYDVNFTINIFEPLEIVYPLNDSYSVDVTELNYTYHFDNPGFCWWNNGSDNSSIVSTGLNFTGIESNEGSNDWTVYCNNTEGKNYSDSVTFSINTTLAYSSGNLTIVIISPEEDKDLLIPIIEI